MELEGKVARLKQLRFLRGEADQLSRRIAALEAAEGEARDEALRERMAARREHCLAQLGSLYSFIDGIEDSQMRQIMACRYIDGLPWRCVAAHIGERDEQYPRRLHNRFLERTELPAESGEGRP